VKVSELERLQQRVDEKALATLDPSIARLSREAAKAFSAAVDAGVVSSMAATMSRLDSVGFANLTPFREAAKSLESMPMMYSARLASVELAEALSAANMVSAGRIRDAFAKVDLGPLLQRRAAETVRYALATVAAAEDGYALGGEEDDPAQTYIARVRGLPSAERDALVEKLGAVIVTLFGLAEYLTRARVFVGAALIVAFALGIYALRRAVEEIDEF
jgi:hypothetical protein